MKLRICICLFSVLTILNLSLLFCGWDFYQDYQQLKQDYSQLAEIMYDYLENSSS